MSGYSIAHNWWKIMVFGLFVVFAQMHTTAKVRANEVQQKPVVISQVQLGGAATGTSEHEYITIYNNSDEDVLVTDWCLEFASTTTYRTIRCITTTNPGIDLYIRARSYVLLVNTAYASANSAVLYDYVFSTNTNMPGTNGSIRLVDKEGNLIDTVGWGMGIAEGTTLGSLSGGNIFQRKKSGDVHTDTNNNLSDFETASTPSVLPSGGLSEVEKLVDECANIADMQLIIPDGYMKDEAGDCFADFCVNLVGLQKTIPDGMYLDDDAKCETIPLEDRPLLIVEIYPNAPSSDTGQEFIELYNPNDTTVPLAGYKIRLGPSFTKEYVFLSGELQSKQYRAFSDTETGIVLPNTTGAQLVLVTPAGSSVSESPVYSNAKDGNSWQVYEDVWMYTNQRTPNGANLPYLEPAVNEEVLAVTSVLAPCPVGKYRNPETNRCRNIETAVSALQPCDEDEYRNTETNRCRKLTSATSTLVPCKAGQVRNPETNRCRAIATTSSLGACPEGQERNPETNRCRKVATLAAQTTSAGRVDDVAPTTSSSFNWPVLFVAVAVAGLYMLYEWRSEISQKLRMRRNK